MKQPYGGGAKRPAIKHDAPPHFVAGNNLLEAIFKQIDMIKLAF